MSPDASKYWKSGQIVGESDRSGIPLFVNVTQVQHPVQSSFLPASQRVRAPRTSAGGPGRWTEVPWAMTPDTANTYGRRSGCDCQ
ncbi:hypothetical protein DPMN_128214 [Dreissena polymorpha]|uniref:Uncharacterized protein n=1 Tax=Dreissena polymorpha TaxID=45954 RepID=A0A9D4H0D9_DREPO|nr:hypothetical protein DPMN_128214 [Dreissena polymorpha]